jgi:hypothetical protein
VAIFLAAFTSSAQVHIQATLPTVGLVQKNQLWNLVLVNGTTSAIDGRLDLVLRDRQDGRELFTATTRNISLAKGATSLNVNSLNPIQYNFISMQPDRSLTGLLPAGAYIACYSFTRTNGEKMEQVSEECISFDTEPLSPPMLLFPGDSSVLETSPGQFTWTPPTPAGMFNRLQYDFIVAEIRAGQKAAEALQDNMSFYTSMVPMNNFLTYPASSPAFEKDKWYAWQVIARNGESYAAKTEPWVFKIKAPDTPAAPVISITYLLLQDEVKGVYSVTTGKVYIKYFSSDLDQAAQFDFYDDKGQPVTSVVHKLRQGDNYLEFDLNKAFRSNKLYTVSITDQSKKRHSLIFSITKN